MQLLKVQERINALTPSPASLAYLKRAVDGMDTEIPPFMALIGMNEMERDLEYASAGQPPEEPINQSLPKQVAQKLGLGQPMQPMQPMQPGQAMQPGQPMQPPGQLAQGIAQPMQQMPQQMAGGGLASIPIDPRMFDYGSGGVVSFAGEASSVVPKLLGVEGAAQDDDDEETSAEEQRAYLKRLRQEIDAERNAVGPVQETAADIEARRRKEGNYGADTGPLGEEYLTGLAQIQKLKAEERARQGDANRTSDYLGIGNALIAAGNATRGQSGMGSFFAGFGQQAGQEMMEAQKRDAALRGQGITETEILNEAKSKIQNLRQAKLSGDVAQVVKLQSELADLASKAKKAKMDSLSTEITAASRIEAARVTAGKARADTKVPEAVFALGQKLTELQQESAADPGNAEKQAAVKVAQQRYAAAMEVLEKIRSLTQNITSTSDFASGGVKEEIEKEKLRLREASDNASKIKDLELQKIEREKIAIKIEDLVKKQLESYKLLDREYNLALIGGDTAKAAALLNALEAKIRKDVTPAAPAASSAAPAASSAAPAAPAAPTRMRYNSAGELIQ